MIRLRSGHDELAPDDWRLARAVLTLRERWLARAFLTL
jgi:hypothetical protein